MEMRDDSCRLGSQMRMLRIARYVWIGVQNITNICLVPRAKDSS